MLFIVAIFLTSCAPVRLNNLSIEDYDKYIRTVDYTSGVYYNSPLSFNMIKGENPFNKYNFKAVRLKTYWFTYYAGDKFKLLTTYFSDAEVIVEFGSYYFIGTRIKEN